MDALSKRTGLSGVKVSSYLIGMSYPVHICVLFAEQNRHVLLFQLTRTLPLFSRPVCLRTTCVPISTYTKQFHRLLDPSSQEVEVYHTSHPDYRQGASCAEEYMIKTILLSSRQLRSICYYKCWPLFSWPFSISHPHFALNVVSIRAAFNHSHSLLHGWVWDTLSCCTGGSETPRLLHSDCVVVN